MIARKIYFDILFGDILDFTLSQVKAHKPDAKRQIILEFYQNHNAKGKGVYFQAFLLYRFQKDYNFSSHENS